MTWGFEEGVTYNRRQDIHGRFRGQQQGGIITPREATAPIILITGEEGVTHGYSDRVRPDGVFEYFGEGQVGDMQMIRGNRAIRDHAESGRDLLLFRKVVGGVRFEGQYVFEAFHHEPAPDKTGAMRQALVFELRPIVALFAADDAAAPPSGINLSDLRDRAIQAAKADPNQTTRQVSAFERSKIVCEYVFARANGRCEDCGAPAPFHRENGTPYLEAHHIRRLTDGGPDDPRFMIAVCPNCHRMAHHAANKSDVNARMLSFVQIKEGQ